MIKFISYNVNGIRAAVNKGLTGWMRKSNPDVLCIQETKAHKIQMDHDYFTSLGYSQYWFSAEKKGYSGVLVLSKIQPDNVIYGMNIASYDSEGRFIRLDFGDTTLINVYIPSGTLGGVRQEFKMKFLNDFLPFISRLKENRPNLIVTGDFNICHKPIDINHPERHKKSSGFLPGERAWMDRWEESGFVDSFRKFNQKPGQYTWWSYRAQSRLKNLGWRIDYFWVSTAVESRLQNAAILPEVNHSDHCPIEIELETV